MDAIFTNLDCDERCLPNGRCYDDSNCQCSQGWNGKFCTIHGCPHDCQGNGECVLSSNHMAYKKLVILYECLMLKSYILKNKKCYSLGYL